MTDIRVYHDADTLAANAVDIIALAAETAIAERGKFSLALAGGSTPEKTYKLLASQSDKIAWAKTYVFLSDERFVPPEDERSNFGMAHRSLLGAVPIPMTNIYAMPTLTDTITQCAADYTNAIAQFFDVPAHGPPPVFDLILLGLGDDGHCASLFPGYPSLDVEDAWLVTSPPGTLPPPVDRITFTFPLINAARQVLFLVAGEKKAEAVQDVLQNGADKHKRPAAGVHPVNGALIWALDAAAASGLDSSTDVG